MNFYELLNSLQNLIKDRKLRQADIARALETSTSNLCQKFSNPNSEVTVAELLKVQEYFGVKIFIKMEEYTDSENSQLAQFKTFGQRLNHLISENDLTVQKLASEIGISEKDLELLELDKAEPDLKILRKLKNYFNVSIDMLVDGKGIGQAQSGLSPEEMKILEVLRKAKRQNLI